jgi:UDP-3-O-[3-hydroxymyristoyl] N-acetylglucosamine deacetylase
VAVKEVVNTLTYRGKGITSRREITVEIERKQPGHGIVFEVADRNGKNFENIPARADFVVNTLRNVVLGIGDSRLCIVEHFLCAASLLGLDDLRVKVDGPEMPLGDGSARVWLDLFHDAGWSPSPVTALRTLAEPIVCRNGDRSLLAVPADSFSVTYMMDWDHPLIGKRWQTWAPPMLPTEIGHARTFGSLQEHQMLGIADEVVSMTADGFTQPLHWPDEPVRHKLLDLVGDLTLSGVNPMSWKARFISIKAGHEMDVQMAKQLASLVCKA